MSQLVYLISLLPFFNIRHTSHSIDFHRTIEFYLTYKNRITLCYEPEEDSIEKFNL